MINIDNIRIRVIELRYIFKKRKIKDRLLAYSFQEKYMLFLYEEKEYYYIYYGEVTNKKGGDFCE